jgi:uncharacterized protein YecE (DUF72 family)
MQYTFAGPMAPTLHIGALLDRAPGRKYAATLHFAEFAPRAPLPRPATLAGMRKEASPDFVFALRAPRSSVVSERGALRFDAQLETGIAWLIAAADALQPRAVLLNTPSDLTPGARSRELLREYVARLPRVEGRSYVWLTQGLWEPEDTRALCNELGLCHAFDPLESEANPGEVAYATLRAFGHRAGFSLAALSDALDKTRRYATREAFVSVDAERAFDVARRLQSLASGQAADDALDDEGADEAESDEDADEPEAE